MRDITDQLNRYQDHLDALYPAVTRDEVPMTTGALADAGRKARWPFLRAASFAAAFALTIGLGAAAFLLRAPADVDVDVVADPSPAPSVTDAPVATTQPPVATTQPPVTTTHPPTATTEPVTTSVAFAAAVQTTVAADGTLILTGDSAGGEVAIAIDGQDRLIVAYWSSDDGLVKLLRCGDSSCATAETLILGQVGSGPIDEGPAGLDMGILPDGSPIVVVQAADPADGTVVFGCTDPACAAVARADFEEEEPCLGDDGGRCASVDFPKLAIGPEGLPRVVYYHAGAGQLRLAVCGDLLCGLAGRSTVIIDDELGVGHGAPTIVIDEDGTILIGHHIEQAGRLPEARVARCDDAVCAGGPSLLAFDGAIGPLVTLGADGEYLVWYRSGPLTLGEGDLDTDAVLERWDLLVARCGRLGCGESVEIDTVWGMLMAWPDDIRLLPAPDGKVAVTFAYWWPGRCASPIEVGKIDLSGATFEGTLSVHDGGYSLDATVADGTVVMVYGGKRGGLHLESVPLGSTTLVAASAYPPADCP